MISIILATFNERELIQKTGVARLVLGHGIRAYDGGVALSACLNATTVESPPATMVVSAAAAREDVLTDFVTMYRSGGGIQADWPSDSRSRVRPDGEVGDRPAPEAETAVGARRLLEALRRDADVARPVSA